MIVVLLVALYLIPTVIALCRQMPNMGSVIVVNIFLGWTGIGWIVALAMALGNSSNGSVNVVVNNQATSVAVPQMYSGQPQTYAAQPQTYTGQPPMLATHPQPSQPPLPQSNGPTWDPNRQAWLHRDPVSGAWLIQSADGRWTPLPVAAPPHSAIRPATLPPPPPPASWQ